MIETEKKYRLPAELRAEVEKRLAEFGAEYLGEDAEENIILGGGPLSDLNSVMRIRKTPERTILTFKKRLPGLSDVKQQIEEETEVADGEAMERVLAAIGITRKLVYEKRRRKWRFRATETVIDELPFGLFMEIEGPLTAIREAEMLLEIDTLEAENKTYPRLTAELGRETDGVIESRF